MYQYGSTVEEVRARLRAREGARRLSRQGMPCEGLKNTVRIGATYRDAGSLSEDRHVPRHDFARQQCIAPQARLPRLLHRLLGPPHPTRLVSLFPTHSLVNERTSCRQVSSPTVPAPSPPSQDPAVRFSAPRTPASGPQGVIQRGLTGCPSRRERLKRGRGVGGKGTRRRGNRGGTRGRLKWGRGR